MDCSAQTTPADGLLPGVGNLSLGGAFNPQEYLLKFQQMLEKDMEAKITHALDAKLTGLSQRLALSELRLFQLHEQMQTRDVKSDANLDRLQQQLKALESQVKLMASFPQQDQRLRTNRRQSKKQMMIKTAVRATVEYCCPPPASYSLLRFARMRSPPLVLPPAGLL